MRPKEKLNVNNSIWVNFHNDLEPQVRAPYKGGE